MLGLTTTSAASASLLQNLEAVLTAVLAWVVFRENTDRRVVLGMALIVAGAVLLAWLFSWNKRSGLGCVVNRGRLSMLCAGQQFHLQGVGLRRPVPDRTQGNCG